MKCKFVLFIYLYMNCWLSPNLPVMSKVFDYLQVEDVQRWRMASHVRASETDAHARRPWADYVNRRGSVSACGVCRRLRRCLALTTCVSCGGRMCAEDCSALTDWGAVFCSMCI